jgi:acyl-CoA-binding protein
MVVTLPAFEKAAVEVQKLTEQPSNEDRLKV